MMQRRDELAITDVDELGRHADDLRPTIKEPAIRLNQKPLGPIERIVAPASDDIDRRPLAWRCSTTRTAAAVAVAAAAAILWL